MDEEAEDRFTELARTRLADTLSEAARMLAGPPGDTDPLSVQPERAGGRGIDDILFPRPAPLGLVPDREPAPAPRAGPDAEAERLRAELERLRGENEDLRRRAGVAEARAEERKAALCDLRRALDRIAEPRPPGAAPPGAAPRAPGGRAIRLVDPALALIPVRPQPSPAAAPVLPGPEGLHAPGQPGEPAVSPALPAAQPLSQKTSEPGDGHAPDGDGAEVAPRPTPSARPLVDGETWVFTQGRRRFWRRR